MATTPINELQDLNEMSDIMDLPTPSEHHFDPVDPKYKKFLRPRYTPLEESGMVAGPFSPINIQDGSYLSPAQATIQQHMQEQFTQANTQMYSNYSPNTYEGFTHNPDMSGIVSSASEPTPSHSLPPPHGPHGPSCVDCNNHVKNCPICSKLYKNSGRIFYIIVIVILVIIVILLLKKVLDV